MVFLKLILAFLAIWFGLVVIVSACWGKPVHIVSLVVFSASVCGLLWTFGIFN